MKVAQYEVLGNDAYREVRPGGTIETFGLLISRTRVPSASTRRSSLPGRVVSKTKPCTEVLGYYQRVPPGRRAFGAEPELLFGSTSLFRQ